MNLAFRWNNEQQKMVGRVSPTPSAGRLVSTTVVDGVIHGVFDAGTFKFQGPVSAVGLMAADTTNWFNRHRWAPVGSVAGPHAPTIKAVDGLSPVDTLLAYAAYSPLCKGVDAIGVDADRRDRFLAKARGWWAVVTA